MHLSAEPPTPLRRAALAGLLACALVWPLAPLLAQERASLPAIDKAAAQLASDPKMPGEHIEKEWRLKKQDDPRKDKDADKAKQKSDRDWGTSLTGLAEASRWLVWLLGAALLLIVLLRLARIARMHADAQQARAALHPQEVGTLDIRPESLPDDIGAAARALWDRGDSHGAMTLLYRAALSRLVHRHAVPIRASSTEGDCLRLAEAHLDADRFRYVQTLTQLWMRVAYGHAVLSAEQALPLFASFRPHLDQDPVEVRA